VDVSKKGEGRVDGRFEGRQKRRMEGEIRRGGGKRGGVMERTMGDIEGEKRRE
jgi:hypothetical protein